MRDENGASVFNLEVKASFTAVDHGCDGIDPHKVSFPTQQTGFRGMSSECALTSAFIKQGRSLPMAIDKRDDPNHTGALKEPDQRLISLRHPIQTPSHFQKRNPYLKKIKAHGCIIFSQRRQFNPIAFSVENKHFFFSCLDGVNETF